MSKPWKQVLMGTLCSIESGKSNTQDAIENGPYIFFDRSKTPKKSSRYLYDCEALIIPGEGTEFLPRHFVGKFDLHQRAYALFDFSSEVDVRYLFYYLTYLKEWFVREAVGATVKSLRRRHFTDLPVILPPLLEQQRIIAILDETFAGIDATVINTEKNLVNARELFDGYMRSVFTCDGDGWVYKKLSEVAVDFSRGKSKHRPRNDPKLYGGPYPFIQTGDIRQSKQLITEASQFYNEAGLAQSKLWPKGTICITIAANIAETAILDFEACFPDSVIGMVVDESQASNRFVEYLLRHMKATLQAEGKGSAQDNINLGTFDRARFPFPPLAEQQRIANELDSLAAAVQQLSQIAQRKLQNLDELKQSILQKAFAGELTAKEAERAMAAA